MLSITVHRLAEGNPANLVVHHHERPVDVFREHPAPRWVISRGVLVASSTATTGFHDV